MTRAREPKTLLVGLEFLADAHRPRGGQDLEELARLVRTAGYHPVPGPTQRRDAPDPATWLGSGVVEQLARQVETQDIHAVQLAFDPPYPVVARLAERLGVPVQDRSELILEIFARHAVTQEGRMQVRRARLDRELHRLLTEERDLDRQAGGIGVRGGPGESAARLARRRIHRKKQILDQRLARLAERRDRARAKRRRAGPARVALAGYTNAGKSTLMNALLGREEVLARDQLFTTLGTTTRRLRTPGGRPVLLSDTVGFVRHLPHELVEAFRSTLTEAAEADLVCLLVAADPERFEDRRDTGEEVLADLGVPRARILPVLSQVDRVAPQEAARMAARLGGAPRLCALQGDGLDALLGAIEARLASGETVRKRLLGHDALAELAALHAAGRVVDEVWTEEGVHVKIRG
jgi:GTP-binding protein HflX